MPIYPDFAMLCFTFSSFNGVQLPSAFYYQYPGLTQTAARPSVVTQQANPANYAVVMAAQGHKAEGAEKSSVAAARRYSPY